MTDATNDPKPSSGAFGSRATVPADATVSQVPGSAPTDNAPGTPGTPAAATPAAPAAQAALQAPREPAHAAVKQTHVARGVVWGILFGLGLTVVSIVTTVIPLSLVPAVIVLLLGVVLGTLWSMFGPAKPPPS